LFAYNIANEFVIMFYTVGVFSRTDTDTAVVNLPNRFRLKKNVLYNVFSIGAGYFNTATSILSNTRDATIRLAINPAFNDNRTIGHLATVQMTAVGGNRITRSFLNKSVGFQVYGDDLMQNNNIRLSIIQDGTGSPTDPDEWFCILAIQEASIPFYTIPTTAFQTLLINFTATSTTTYYNSGRIQFDPSINYRVACNGISMRLTSTNTYADIPLGLVVVMDSPRDSKYNMLIEENGLITNHTNDVIGTSHYYNEIALGTGPTYHASFASAPCYGIVVSGDILNQTSQFDFSLRTQDHYDIFPSARVGSCSITVGFFPLTI
jgi:hypothetical protein